MNHPPVQKPQSDDDAAATPNEADWPNANNRERATSKTRRCRSKNLEVRSQEDAVIKIQSRSSDGRTVRIA